MELIGSKVEKDFREELIRSNIGLREPSSRLGQILVGEGCDTRKAYVLHCTPDQLEDFYTVLIEGSYLLTVEISKSDSSEPAIVERTELKSYKHGLSKVNQVRLLVAQELACTKT